MEELHCFEGGSVVKCLESRNKFEAIRELIKKVPLLSHQPNHEQIEAAAINRERIYTTGLGRGIAIAHGKTEGLKDLVIVLGISRQGINFNALDGKPVHLLFLIVNPPQKNTQYLIALSTLAHILRDEAFRTFLIGEINPRIVEQRISQAFQSCIKKRYN